MRIGHSDKLFLASCNFLKSASAWYDDLVSGEDETNKNPHFLRYHTIL